MSSNKEEGNLEEGNLEEGKTGKNKKVGIKCIVGIVAVLIVGTIAVTTLGGNKTSEFGVEKPKNEQDTLKTELGITEEKFIDIINKDSYITGKYELYETKLEDIRHIENTDKYDFSELYGIDGVNEDRTQIFSGSIQKHTNFEDYSAVSLIYEFKEGEIDTVLSSAESIVGQMYDSEITDKLFSSKGNTSDDIIDEGEDFFYSISKIIGEASEDGYKSLMVRVSLDSIKYLEYSIEDYETEENAVYNQIPAFVGVELKELSKEYSDIVGGYEYTGILNFMNEKYRDIENSTLDKDFINRTNDIRIATVFEDDNQTDINIYAAVGGFEGEEETDGSLVIETVTRFEDSKEGALKEAIKIPNGLFKQDFKLTKEEIEDGEFEKQFRNEFNGLGYEVTVYGETIEEDGRHYCTITILSGTE